MEELLKKVNSLLKVPKTKKITIPSPLIVNSKNRPGLSPIKMANEVLEYKRELGLPVGNFDDGTANYDDLLILKIFQVLVENLQTEAAITVSISPGIKVSGSAGPVPVQGATTEFAVGGAIIQ